MSDTVRISLDLSPAQNEELEAMAEQLDTTKSNLLRKALTLMAVVVDESRKGKHIGVSSDPEVLEPELIII